MTKMGRALAAFAPPLALVGLPAVALAHGITGRATNLSTLEYIPLGIEHMLLGWDHLLFVFGIVLLAGSGKRAAKLISLFVLGHSLTLIAGTLYEWRLSPTFVDGVIAISVVFVAALGIKGRPKDWTLPAIVILLFGLIHGLGLSTRLQDLGIPDNGLIAKTIAFNLGIEIGQLLAVLTMVAIIVVIREFTPAPRWKPIKRGLFGAIAVAGAVGAVLLFAGVGDENTAVAGSTSSCERMALVVDASGAGQHPEQEFFGPDEAAPEQDLAHVRGDGFVIVRYRPDLDTAQVTELRGWIEGNEKAIVAAADPEQKEPLIGQVSTRLISCQDYDLAALQTFAQEWFAEATAG